MYCVYLYEHRRVVIEKYNKGEPRDKNAYYCRSWIQAFDRARILAQRRHDEMIEDIKRQMFKFKQPKEPRNANSNP